MDLSWQSDVPAFQHTVYTCHSFPSKKQMYLNFMAVVTVPSDFGAQENKSVTASTFSPTICHEVMGQDTKILAFEC